LVHGEGRARPRLSGGGGSAVMSGAQPLVVRIEDILAREVWVYVFSDGPVWVGCGPTASLTIVRPFISLQHGCFHFDHRSVRYQDLAPGVGTIVDGVVAGGSEVPLTEWSQI